MDPNRVFWTDTDEIKLTSKSGYFEGSDPDYQTYQKCGASEMIGRACRDLLLVQTITNA